MMKTHAKIQTESVLESLLNAQATLDAIMLEESDSWLRLTNRIRVDQKDVRAFRVDNGAGDHLVFAFTPFGSVIKGFDHENEPVEEELKVEADDYYKNMPEELKSLVFGFLEPELVSFCVWKTSEHDDWMQSVQGDSHNFLLGYVSETPEIWYEWAEAYYEEEAEALKIESVKAIYEGKALTQEIVDGINPKRKVLEILNR